jgi:RNA recognition motif-containing protein
MTEIDQSILSKLKATFDKPKFDHATGTTIFVANINHNASESELDAIFSAVSVPKAINMPRDDDGSRRGIALIEYHSHS